MTRTSGVVDRATLYRQLGGLDPWDWAMKALPALLKPDVQRLQVETANRVAAAIEDRGEEPSAALAQAVDWANQQSQGRVIGSIYHSQDDIRANAAAHPELAGLPQGFIAFRAYPGATQIGQEELAELVSIAVRDGAAGFRITGTAFPTTDIDVKQVEGSRYAWSLRQDPLG